MFAFWLGTLPALLCGRLIMQSLAFKFQGAGNQIVAFLFILAGLFSFYERVQNVPPSAEGGNPVSCR
jgi:hypothetical protein